jgi:hypothetical protein
MGLGLDVEAVLLPANLPASDGRLKAAGAEALFILPDFMLASEAGRLADLALTLFVVVLAPLLASGASDARFTARDLRAMLDALLRTEATAAAARIESFLGGIVGQLGATVQKPGAPRRRRSAGSRPWTCSAGSRPSRASRSSTATAAGACFSPVSISTALPAAIGRSSAP